MKTLKKNLQKKVDDVGLKVVTMTITEKAQLVRDREMARQDRDTAQEALEITTKDLEISKRTTEGERSWKKHYQEENGKLHNELFRKRSASFCFGVAFGLIFSLIMIHFY